jgi:hypothetical protein
LKTVDLFTFTATSPISSTETRTFESTDSSIYVGATDVPMVILVHKAEDMSGNNGGGAPSSTPNPTSTNAASSVRMGPNAGGQWALLVAIVAMTMGSFFFMSLMSMQGV